MPTRTARWLGPAGSADLAEFVKKHPGSVAHDRDGAFVFLARNAWELNDARSDWRNLRFADTREIVAFPEALGSPTDG